MSANINVSKITILFGRFDSSTCYIVRNACVKIVVNIVNLSAKKSLQNGASMEQVCG